MATIVKPLREMGTQNRNQTKTSAPPRKVGSASSHKQMTDKEKRDAERRRRHAERFNQPVPQLIYEQVINDEGRTITKTYRRGKLLGKGGFARCFVFTDVYTNEVFAGKVVQKSSLKRTRAREKLMAEIKIHRGLSHPHVVKFIRHFEDATCHYMLMELCPNQTLMEMVKRRKRLTEPEVRYFLYQLVLALEYLHSKNIIHRDLKLGNLFLSQHMRIRIGDFGLSTQVDAKGQKKTTICGTPNYIAPEVLHGAKVGHSFEVDVWSLGCILYTLLVGKPPFQTDNVKKTYHAIRHIHYSFPSHSNASTEARSMVTQLLTKDPATRLSLAAIKAHPFIASHINTIPRHIPDWFRYAAPTIQNGDMVLSSHNLHRQTGNHHSIQRTANPVNRAALQQVNTNSPSVSRKTVKESQHQKVCSSSNVRLSSKPPAGTETISNTKGIGSTDAGLHQFHYNLKRSLVSPARQRARIERGKADSKKILSAVMTNGHVESPRLWVTKWVDYTSKYGLGYLTCNGSVGIYFNDSSKIVLSSGGEHFEYIERSRKLPDGTRSPAVREPHTLSNYPTALKKKVLLVKHFKSHLLGQQTSLNKCCPEEKEQRLLGSPSYDMVYVKKWVRTRHAILFRLSNHSVQVCFFDKSEIILCAQGTSVTYCNKQGVRATHHLDTVMARYPDIAKRLKYTKDILHEVLNLNDGRTKTQKPTA
jgi:polo-like kinase 1